jgi:hypothetical protein
LLDAGYEKIAGDHICTGAPSRATRCCRWAARFFQGLELCGPRSRAFASGPAQKENTLFVAECLDHLGTVRQVPVVVHDALPCIKIWDGTTRAGFSGITRGPRQKLHCLASAYHVSTVSQIGEARWAVTGPIDHNRGKNCGRRASLDPVAIAHRSVKPDQDRDHEYGSFCHRAPRKFVSPQLRLTAGCQRSNHGQNP